MRNTLILVFLLMAGCGGNEYIQYPGAVEYGNQLCAAHKGASSILVFEYYNGVRSYSVTCKDGAKISIPRVSPSVTPTTKE